MWLPTADIGLITIGDESYDRCEYFARVFVLRKLRTYVVFIYFTDTAVASMQFSFPFK